MFGPHRVVEEELEELDDDEDDDDDDDDDDVLRRWRQRRHGSEAEQFLHGVGSVVHGSGSISDILISSMINLAIWFGLQQMRGAHLVKRQHRVARSFWTFWPKSVARLDIPQTPVRHTYGARALMALMTAVLRAGMSSVQVAVNRAMIALYKILESVPRKSVVVMIHDTGPVPLVVMVISGSQISAVAPVAQVIPVPTSTKFNVTIPVVPVPAKTAVEPILALVLFTG
jgi:hypothetical protein